MPSKTTWWSTVFSPSDTFRARDETAAPTKASAATRRMFKGALIAAALSGTAPASPK